MKQKINISNKNFIKRLHKRRHVKIYGTFCIVLPWHWNKIYVTVTTHCHFSCSQRSKTTAALSPFFFSDLHLRVHNIKISLFFFIAAHYNLLCNIVKYRLRSSECNWKPEIVFFLQHIQMCLFYAKPKCCLHLRKNLFLKGKVGKGKKRIDITTKLLKCSSWLTISAFNQI